VHTAHAEPRADIELTLALDASGSMFDVKNEGVKNWDTQIGGHVYALGQQEVIEKLIGGRVHLRVILWSDGKVYPLVFDGLVRTEHDLVRASVSLKNFKPSCVGTGCGGTNHGTAILRTIQLPQMGYLRVLDISTDEATNANFRLSIDSLRKEFSLQDGTINALAVGLSEKGENDLKKNLCTQNGFCFRAVAWSDYAKTLTRKIITEIA
jgi:hypothetical protein